MTRAEFWRRVERRRSNGRTVTPTELLCALGNGVARAVLERRPEAFGHALETVAAIAWDLWTARAALPGELFVELVALERDRQMQRWGRGIHSGEKWLAILTEEAGEVADAMIAGSTGAVSMECIQVAAVCLRIVEEFTPEVSP